MVQRNASNPAADQGFAHLLDRYRDRPGVEEGRMFGSVGLKVHGKVFAMVVNGALVVKLPAPRAGALIQSGQCTAFDPGHGRPMKEWVSVSEGGATLPKTLIEGIAGLCGRDRAEKQQVKYARLRAREPRHGW